jgi:signal transduction histidine kinase
MELLRPSTRRYGPVVLVLAASVPLAVLLDKVLAPQMAQLVSDHLMTAIPALVAVLSFVVASRRTGRDRSVWILFGLWGTFSATGNALWTYYEFVTKTNPFPSLADVGYLAGNLCAVAAVATIALGTKRVSRSRAVLDCTLIAGSVLLVSWVVVLRAVHASTGMNSLMGIVSMTYPVIDVVFVSIVVFVASRSQRADRFPLLILGLGVLGWAFADSSFAFLTAVEKYQSGGWIDAGWITGDALVALAAFHAMRRKNAGESTTEESIPQWRLQLPYVAAGVALVVALAMQIGQAHIDHYVLLGLMALLVVVIARQFLVVVDQQKLTIERMESVDEMKNGILRAVSHELRTPLTFIKGAAMLLNDEETPVSEETRRDLLGRLEGNCDRLEDFLTGLLDLERLTRGVIEPARRSTEVRQLLVRIAESLHVDAITINGKETWADVDSAQVERIVENLMVNALRHTPEGTPVRAEAARIEGGVLITVEDDGPGVPADLKTQIFEPFAQSPDSLAVGRGTGIGLALVAKFAQLHGGRAWVEDAEDGGARFCVLLADGTSRDAGAVPDSIPA